MEIARAGSISGASGIVVMLAMTGCQDYRGPVSIKSDDPDLQIVAMRQDVSEDNRGDLPMMVQDLTSDDPAIRFYAIQSLHRLTHDDFGYHYYETDDERAPGLARWQKWLKDQNGSNPQK